MVRSEVRKLERVRIAAAVDDLTVAAHHQPPKIPIPTRVSHRHIRTDSYQWMRSNHEQLLLRVIIRGTALHKDFVIQAAILLFAEVRTEIADAEFDRAAQRERIDKLLK